MVATEETKDEEDWKERWLFDYFDFTEFVTELSDELSVGWCKRKREDKIFEEQRLRKKEKKKEK